MDQMNDDTTRRLGFSKAHVPLKKEKWTELIFNFYRMFVCIVFDDISNWSPNSLQDF